MLAPPGPTKSPMITSNDPQHELSADRHEDAGDDEDDENDSEDPKQRGQRRPPRVGDRNAAIEFT